MRSTTKTPKPYTLRGACKCPPTSQYGAVITDTQATVRCRMLRWDVRQQFVVRGVSSGRATAVPSGSLR
eukprot:gene11583-biopygen13943